MVGALQADAMHHRVHQFLDLTLAAVARGDGLHALPDEPLNLPASVGSRKAERSVDLPDTDCRAPVIGEAQFAVQGADGGDEFDHGGALHGCIVPWFVVRVSNCPWKFSGCSPHTPHRCRRLPPATRGRNGVRRSCSRSRRCCSSRGRRTRSRGWRGYLRPYRTCRRAWGCGCRRG